MVCLCPLPLLQKIAQDVRAPLPPSHNVQMNRKNAFAASLWRFFLIFNEHGDILHRLAIFSEYIAMFECVAIFYFIGNVSRYFSGDISPTPLTRNISRCRRYIANICNYELNFLLSRQLSSMMNAHLQSLEVQCAPEVASSWLSFLFFVNTCSYLLREIIKKCPRI